MAGNSHKTVFSVADDIMRPWNFDMCCSPQTSLWERPNKSLFGTPPLIRLGIQSLNPALQRHLHALPQGNGNKVDGTKRTGKVSMSDCELLWLTSTWCFAISVHNTFGMITSSKHNRRNLTHFQPSNSPYCHNVSLRDC